MVRDFFAMRRAYILCIMGAFEQLRSVVIAFRSFLQAKS